MVCTLICLIALNASKPQTQTLVIPNAERFYVAQADSELCWAACNQMLLKAAGINASQTDQAKRRQAIYGGSLNWGAGATYKIAAECLRGTYTSGDKTYQVEPFVSNLTEHNPRDPETILESLKKGQPLVMATTQHGYVCYGVDYVSSGSYIQITDLYLLDPGCLYFSPPRPRQQKGTMQGFVQSGGMGFMGIKVTSK